MDKEQKEKKHSRFSRKKKAALLQKEDITIVDTKVAKKAVVATGMGNAMEWFDFGIYSYLAATIGKIFFPEFTGPTQLVFSFATFAIAFLVRPIGGMFFGMLGDRLGRKKILAITLVMMAFATLCIGLIPSYHSIGITAPILLLVARLIQGFSTGGEYSGAMTFIAESTPDKKRGIMSSGLEVGTLVGYIFGSGIVTLLTFILGSDSMLSWGWRIPFLIAAPIGLIGLYLRNNLEESPAFEAMEKEKENENRHVSMKDILVYHRKPLLVGMILVFFYNIVDYTVLSYMPSHLNAVLNYGETKGLLLILIVMFIMIPIVLIMGYFGDRIGSKRIIQGGLIGLILLSFPSFLMIGSGNNWLVFFGLMILAVFLASFQGTMPSLLPSLFFTDVRYGALAITYNISASIFGGTAPLVIAWFISLTSSNFIPAYYLILSSLIGIGVVTFLVKDPSGKPLRGSAPAVEEKQEIKEILEDPEEALWWTEEKKRIDNKINEQYD
ncbi:MHS family proline/betaine transporter-like MFS transporter [Pullulanibacillus pueri]|uniref:Putative proline/betaine transporter n=1 Tax=Pullulanibacillus pueri TaxID=1437324 RepID=A0A8J2ZVY4_9BACL|nr:MFS transporter [Pullulanibacillus pueri]MBM7682457.1 MHS family proline/betaine transporter-like MFS transporter [Pullulanibacillus pueri]GGH81563.1 MFS transporter [Pullulanibacillus pueri]